MDKNPSEPKFLVKMDVFRSNREFAMDLELQRRQLLRQLIFGLYVSSFPKLTLALRLYHSMCADTRSTYGCTCDTCILSVALS